MSSQPTFTEKKHYIALDGLRGIAAIIILFFHYLEMIYLGDYKSNPLGHGYLAVDFFFSLSGFVIAYAYDDRMKAIGLKKFFINRLVRLHPLVVFGTILGMICFFISALISGETLNQWYSYFFVFLLSIFLIPNFFLKDIGTALFPYNTPSWSLFSEYIANIIYALFLYKVKKKTLLVLTIVFACLLVYYARKTGSLIGGWDRNSFFDGLVRVCFSFSMGIVIFRYKLICFHKFGLLLPCILLLFVFVFPHHARDWITELILVMIVFPLTLSLGAGTEISNSTKKFCVFIGKLSYPLYMTHIGFVFIFWSLHEKYFLKGELAIAILSVFILFNIIFAYFITRYIDEPFRKWLSKKLKN